MVVIGGGSFSYEEGTLVSHIPVQIGQLLLCEVPRGEKMLHRGTDPVSYITEYTPVYEEKRSGNRSVAPSSLSATTTSRVIDLTGGFSITNSLVGTFRPDVWLESLFGIAWNSFRKPTVW